MNQKKPYSLKYIKNNSALLNAKSNDIHWFGIDSLTDSNYYSTAAAPAGIVGTSSGFYAQVWFRLNSQSISSATRTICGTYNGSFGGGWDIETLTTNSTIRALMTNGSSSGMGSSQYTVKSSDIGTFMHAVVVHTGTSFQLYVNGNLIGTTAITGYTVSPSNGATYLGRKSTTNSSAQSNIIVFGLSGGNYVPNAQEIFNAYEAGYKCGNIVPIPNKTDHLWNVSQDSITTRTIPTTLKDRIGTSDMTETGSPTLIIY